MSITVTIDRRFVRISVLGIVVLAALAAVGFQSWHSGEDAAHRFQAERDHQREDRYRAMFAEHHLNDIAYQLHIIGKRMNPTSRSKR